MAWDNLLMNFGGVEELVVKADDLVPFKDHPFKVDTESSDFAELVDSIREFGILHALYVRKSADYPGKYEILSGHRRREAARECDVEIPVYVCDLDDYEAALMMTQTNTAVREKILPSEKAKAYKICMDAAREEGNTDDDIAAQIGGEEDSRRQVYRYLRLANLNDELLDKVDKNTIRKSTGVELSYLDERTQDDLLRFMEENEITPLLEDAKELRSQYEENGNNLSYDDIQEILMPLDEEKPKKTSKKGLSIKRDVLNDYFDSDMDIDEIKGIVMSMLEKYKAGELSDILD